MYYAPKRESRREVEPYHLIFQWSSWYLWGWCVTRQDFRLFKLNRMADIQKEETFEKRLVPLPDFSQERVFPSVYSVKAVIHPDFKWRLVEEYGLESFIEQPDGTLLFSAGFADKTSVICWIASFGEGAELLEPVELRQSILAFTEGIRQKYVKK